MLRVKITSLVVVISWRVCKQVKSRRLQRQVKTTFKNMEFAVDNSPHYKVASACEIPKAAWLIICFSDGFTGQVSPSSSRTKLGTKRVHVIDTSFWVWGQCHCSVCRRLIHLVRFEGVPVTSNYESNVYSCRPCDVQ